MNEIIAAIEMPKRTIDKRETAYLRKAARLFMHNSAAAMKIMTVK